MTDTIRIAVVQSACGHVTCAGPNDFRAQDGYKDAMDAAISYHIEAGWSPAACHWVEAPIPAIPPIPVVPATVESVPVPELGQ
jgi:hypothetical protein